MSLSLQIQTLLAGRATGATPFTIEVEEDCQRLTCEFAALDSLSCALSQFALTTAKLADATPPRLKRLAEQLSSRLTYLLEPIRPIEADDQQCVVQMRSNPPQLGDDGASYYELVIRRGGELSLCRWQKAKGNERRRVPANLTREVLWRLIDDFSAAVR